MADRDDLTLYYFPTSYYSLKVLLAFYEKNVPFKGCVINIHDGEQNADWFKKINLAAEVPALQDGSKIIAGSESILDYLENLHPADTPLIPDVNTPKGKAVQAFRQRLQDIPIDQISFGVIVNQSLCTREMQGVMGMMVKKLGRKRIVKKMAGDIASMQKTLWMEPGPQEELRQKLTKTQARADVMFDIEKVTAVLDDLNPVLDEIENLLKASKADCGGKSSDYWLFDADYSMADVCAAIFFYRLEFVCIEGRFFSSDKRPLVLEYYNRLKARAGVQKAIQMSESVGKVYRKTFLKKAAVTSVKIGAVVGVVALGIWGCKNYLKEST